MLSEHMSEFNLWKNTCRLQKGRSLKKQLENRNMKPYDKIDFL